MLANAMLAFWRNVTRHRLYTALNIAGLSLGVAVFLVLALVVRYESRFDAWIPGVSDLYRLDIQYHFPGAPAYESGAVSFRAYDDLRTAYPQIEDATRFSNKKISARMGDKLMSDDVDYVDPQYLRLFRYPLVSGQAQNALSRPDGLVLTQTTARAWFGSTDVLGRHVDVTFEGETSSHVVTGVLRDLPATTSFRPHALMLFTNKMQGEGSFHQWLSSSGDVVFRMDAQTAHAVSRDLPNFVRRSLHTADGQDANKYVSLRLVPVSGVHFSDLDVREGVKASDRRVVACLGVVGVLALLAAAINYVNLATARSLLRAREVAMRKVLGATRAALIGQYLIEAVVLVAVAGFIGAALAELALPVVASLGGWHMRYDYGFVACALLAIIVVVGLGAGAYPALALASYSPGTVLAASRAASGGRASARVRGILVGVQFAFAVGFAICAIVVQAQASFIRNADRGFQSDGLIVIKSMADDGLKSRQFVIADALRRIPGVESVTLQNFVPGNDGENDTDDFKRAGLTQSVNLAERTIGPHYFETYRMRLVAGRLTDEAHGQDDVAPDPKAGNIVIDLDAVAALGFASPQAALGQEIVSGQEHHTIVGVIGNVRFGSAREGTQPQIYLLSRAPFNAAYAAVRVRGATPEMIAKLGAAWRSLVPGLAFSAEPVRETLSQYYRPDAQRGALFTAGAVVAILIACLGLYGLASFNAMRRMHEVGIRKTLGATTGQVLVLVIGQFLRPVVIAGVLACPIAYGAMRLWLAGFEQRIALSPLYFVVVLVGAMLVCGGAVFGQTFRLARAEPARALRAG